MYINLILKFIKMASERYIDLQLIKPLTKGSGNKGKISLTNLLKEYFVKLNVGFLDSCCPEGSPGAFGCPAISEDEGNIIECRDDGIYATAEGGGFLTAANNGLSLDGTTVQLGGPLTEATVITGDSNTETISFLGATTGNFVTINNTDLTGKALHSEGEVRLLGPKVYVGNRTIEGTNENFFVSATLRSYSEYSTSSNPTRTAGFASIQQLYLNDGASITSNATNNYSNATIRIRGAATILNATNPLDLGIRCDTFFARATDAVAASVVTGSTNPIFPVTSMFVRMGCTLATGPVTMTGWYSGIAMSLVNTVSAHSIENYADIILGCQTLGNGATTTNRHGLYINPILGAGVTNAYGIYQVGTSDLNYFGGKVKIGNTYSAPTAYLHLGAGTTAASTAPLKFTSGTNNTTAETGAMEYDGTNLFFTRTGTTRESVFVGVDAATAPATGAFVSPVNFYGLNDDNLLATPNSWASVVIAGTTYKIPLYT